jgi:hypothetical protein
MQEFEQLAQPLYERIVNNVRQSRTLAALQRYAVAQAHFQ